MPLSINKLQNLLEDMGFIANKYFVMDGTCFFIEVFSAKTTDIFFLYIPSKYNFEMSSGQNVYKIKYINMNESDHLPDEYAGTPDNVDIEAVYGDVDIQLSPDKHKIAEQLENNYNHPISIRDISQDDIVTLKAMYRQMKRLRFCTQNIKYKLAVTYKNYICSIRRDDSIDCFWIKHFPRNPCKQLLVVSDLEMVYEKNERINSDMKHVRDGVYKVLQKNQGMYSRVIDKMLENREEIAKISVKAQRKKEQYDILENKLKQMFHIMISAEKKQLEKQEQYSKENNNTGLQADISRVHQLSQVDRELDKILRVKSDIVKLLLQLREKRGTVVLSMDKIMFDNTVMFDCMIKNFAKLKGFME